jgi:hypothetical protein
MNLFYRDAILNLQVTWNRLIEEINVASSYNPYCNSSSYYEIFKHIITSLVLGEEIVLIDSDFPATELKKLTGHLSFEMFSKLSVITNREKILSKTHLLKSINKSKATWKITLFSSGTTGFPKRITHDLNQ